MVGPMYEKINIECSDVLKFPCDVLVLKYAQAPHGVDSVVSSLLARDNPDIEPVRPGPGGFTMVPSRGIIAAKHVLFIGVEWLGEFSYREIRKFAAASMRILRQEMPGVRHVAMTMHGTGYGLDEREAFLAQIAGMADACDQQTVPESLERISIVERKPLRAMRLLEILNGSLPPIRVEGRGLQIEGAKPLAPPIDAGLTSDAKPHVFVAMPYGEEMEDVFVFGIQGPVNGAGFLCERIDMSAFTGDILTRIKQRIEAAAVVVADLTGSNANVYLEVGYAWGKGRPTLLLAKQGEELKFDVRGQRCIVYKNIADLSKKLAADLLAIKKS